jgi:hypothetical protein
MKIARFQVIIWFFIIVTALVTYRVLTSELVDPTLKQARIAYEKEKLQMEREQLKRFDALETERLRVKQASLRRENDLTYYGVIALLSTCGLALIILAAGYSRAKITRASVHVARIGQHSEIPIHQKDLQNFYPIAVNLSLAEIEASVSTTHEKAYRISRQMVEDITEYTRTLAGKRGMLALGPGAADTLTAEASALTATPTCAELLHNGLLAPHKPLILGYDRQGQPQTRTLQDLKSVAIAGWQGSGKTLSTGYLVATSVLAYDVHAYIVDPHKRHPESLATLLQPLEATGHVTMLNPFDTPALLQELNQTLDRRLNGQEASEPGILLVIDEMERLAKMDCFDVLIAFLERCTEETRKANITFIGGSHKWTARHFKGRADIRSCMNSMLIHKTKPSQADLLLEDAHDKNLVKQLHRPGDAILVTDYATPTLVTIPYCKREDMKAIAELVMQNGYTSQAKQPTITITATEIPRQPLEADEALRSNTSKIIEETEVPQKSPQESAEAVKKKTPQAQSQEKEETLGKERKLKKPHPLSGVIPFELHLKKHNSAHPAAIEPQQLTIELIQERLQQRKAQDRTLSQASVARQIGLSPSQFSKILKGQQPLRDVHKQKLYKLLFNQQHTTMNVY